MPIWAGDRDFFLLKMSKCESLFHGYFNQPRNQNQDDLAFKRVSYTYHMYRKKTGVFKSHFLNLLNDKITTVWNDTISCVRL